MSAQATETGKCEEGDPKSTESLVTASVQVLQANRIVKVGTRISQGKLTKVSPRILAERRAVKV